MRTYTSLLRGLLLVFLAAGLAGCATTLTDAGSSVRVVSEQGKQGCAFLQLITTQASLGPDKAGSALKTALNETATAGGNALYLVSSHQTVFDGASVAGEALRCPA